MKLLFCKACGDVFRFAFATRKCECGQSSGWLLRDGDHVHTVGEQAAVIGISNTEMMKAIAKENPTRRLHFDAWVFNTAYPKILRGKQ